MHMEKTTTDDQCWLSIISMTQSQHWSVWSVHVKDNGVSVWVCRGSMVERTCTEGLILPFQRFMINWAIVLISLTPTEGTFPSIAFQLNIFIHLLSNEWRNILQEMNSRNGSHNNLNNYAIIYHPHNSKDSKNNWCLCFSWQIEKHWTLAQLPRMPKKHLEELNVGIK